MIIQREEMSADGVYDRATWRRMSWSKMKKETVRGTI